MNLIELDEDIANFRAIVIYGAFDTNKLNKSERTALETLQVAASQLQALHSYTVLRVGITFDSSLPFPFTMLDATEEGRPEITVTKGPCSRLTIPPFISSRLLAGRDQYKHYKEDNLSEAVFVARDIWKFVDLFQKGLDTHEQDASYWVGDVPLELLDVACKVIYNVKATLKTIEPPAASIKQDAA
ncbi:hypothetical protein [Rothia nasimurium]|uniref:hypothetical protein n=1 Tax=Rothia nasimurium TaxID=85336 RepID=UPI002DD6393D|nr:hypothetical protein [Rothia nasimurium]